MIQKKKIVVYLLLAMMAVCAVGCRYDEGPWLSFRQPEDRIVGYWKLADVYKNGNDIDSTGILPFNPGSYYAFFTERMLSVSALSADSTIWYESVNGAWEFSNKEKDVEILFILKNKKYRYVAEIKKLTRNELIYEFNDDHGDHWRFEFDSRSTMYY